MARLYTIGYETQVSHRGDHAQLTRNGDATVETGSRAFDGATYLRLEEGTESGVEHTIAHGTTAYFQVAYRIDNLTWPEGNITIAKGYADEFDTWDLIIREAGDVVLWNPKTLSNLFETGFHPNESEHYLYEVKCKTAAAGNGEIALRIIDGKGNIVYESATVSANLVNAPIWIWMAVNYSGGAPNECLCSHLILNDSTGSFETSWPGFQKVVMLRPKYDDTVVGFTGADGGTSNLYDAVNNYPPLGRANNSANDTDLTQIRSANNNSTDFYECGTFAYSDPVGEGGGGLAVGDVIRCVMAVARGANSTTTSRNMALKVGSNPFIAEVTKGTGTTAGATESIGWSTINTGYSYNPTLEEAPLNEGCWPIVRKGTASSNAMMFDMVGVYVSYVPAPPSPPGPVRGSVNLLSVGR